MTLGIPHLQYQQLSQSLALLAAFKNGHGTDAEAANCAERAASSLANYLEHHVAPVRMESRPVEEKWTRRIGR